MEGGCQATGTPRRTYNGCGMTLPSDTVHWSLATPVKIEAALRQGSA
ncbi:MAG: hypothetical protein K0S21_2301 [Rhizobiaceae bacterium]|nr:hypothetical protein [Rhizobiaceae bacterium]